MSQSFTAKVVVQSKTDHGNGGPSSVSFRPDYDQGRNAEWAEATPALSLALTVKAEIADRLEVGDTYTLTFTESD